MAAGQDPASAALTVRPLSVAEHRRFVERQRWTSFLQTPTWSPMRPQWRPESIGWFRQGEAEPVGAGVVLQRPVPGLSRRTFAYFAEGPVIDWGAPRLEEWLEPMAAHLRAHGAFGIRVGPMLMTGRWTAEQVKAGLADDAVRDLRELPSAQVDPVGPAVVAQLERLGWRSQNPDGGWGSGQPRYNFHVPLTTLDPSGTRVRRTEADLLAAMNQQWRRNIRRAEREGVDVTEIGPAADPAELDGALRRFHELYEHTADRDGFPARELDYFQRMFASVREEAPQRIRLLLARHQGELVAAAIMVTVGVRVWYAYGASASTKREVQGPSALQWAMMRRALESGADVYDMRGITSTLDPEDQDGGLVRWKVGTGGEAVEYVGEYDLPLRPLLYRAFSLYTRPR